MTRLRTFLVAAIVAAGLLLRLDAQELPTSAEPNSSPAPEAQPAINPAPAPQLIPEDILPAPRPDSTVARPPVPTISELDASLQPPPPSPVTDAYRRHVEWRKLRNQTENDPDVKAALAAARAAPTDLEKRKLLGRYYDLLYRKMIAQAPADMKQYLSDRKRDAVAVLPQPRVRRESVAPAAKTSSAAGKAAAGQPPTPAAAATVPAPSPPDLLSRPGAPAPLPSR